MLSMKRLALAAVLAVSVAMLAHTPAQAKHDEYDTKSVTYELVNVGDEPLATGQVTEKDAKFIPDKDGNWDDGWDTYYLVRVTVTCQNLTPGATYSAGEIGTFTADRKGNGQVSGKVLIPADTWTWLTVAVSRLNPDGSSTLVLVSP